jgi:ATP-dependent Lon protease
MTGEITLLGQVLPVGGIREKVLAAKRNRIFQVILPAANKTDLEELEPWTVEGMQFHFVSDFTEVFNLALGN